MKKLSLIAGLACLATVGGVFGAWVFGTNGATATLENQSVSITSTELITQGNVTAEIANGAKLTVDQDKTAEGLAQGKGVVSVAGDSQDIVITVTPGVSGTGSLYNISCTAEWSAAGTYVTTTEAPTFTQQDQDDVDDGKIVFTLDDEALAGLITVSGVTDEGKYAAMNAELAALKLTFTIIRQDLSA